MDAVNFRDPSSQASRIYVGHLNNEITEEHLHIKFSPYGRIAGLLRTQPGFAFIQYDYPECAINAISAENGSILCGQRLLVKSAEMKVQHKKQQFDDQQSDDNTPPPKKHFSEPQEFRQNAPMTMPHQQNLGPEEVIVNHCEIIVTSRNLQEYAEVIETRLKNLGIVVDLLFPNQQVPINKVLGNIQSRGCLYAILVLPDHCERQSLTLFILHGDSVEHRNIPIDDAVKMIYTDFVNKTKKIKQPVYQHPNTIQTLIKTLIDNRSLTVLQYDHMIKYLTSRCEAQTKAEIGDDNLDEDFTGSFNLPTVTEPTPSTSTAASSNEPKTDMQQKILSMISRREAAKEEKPKPLTEAEKAEFSKKVMDDDRVKRALEALKKNRNK